MPRRRIRGTRPRQRRTEAYTFASETHPVEVREGKVPLPEKPDGRETAIGAALDDLLRQEGGKRVLGIILTTDGRQQAVAPRDLPPQTVAARLQPPGHPGLPGRLRPIARTRRRERRGRDARCWPTSGSSSKTS